MRVKQLVVVEDHGGTVPTVRLAPTIGLVAQVTLLAVLGATVRLGEIAWFVGVAYAIVVWALLTRGLEHSGVGSFGPANWITLSRTALVGAVTALVVEAFHRDPALPALVTITAVALVLDGVDGQVARRTGTTSGLGARFDMEVDAFLILVLSVYMTTALGAWVLAIGAMRYLFVAASWFLPWMRGQLPPRFWRKVVAAVQGVALLVAAAGVLPDSATL